jgi:hypothetical protein
LFDLHGVFLVGPREPLADAPDVGVDEDPVIRVRLRPAVREHDVRGLPRDAGKRRQRGERARDLAAELLDDLPSAPGDRFGLLPEEPGRVDDLLDVVGSRSRQCLRVRVALEQLRRDLVDGFVGGLRREDRGDQELVGTGMV